MNTIITKIAVEAQVEHCISHVRLQKFAELIVAECAHAVQNRGGMCGALASNWIKEHFGVKE